MGMQSPEPRILAEIHLLREGRVAVCVVDLVGGGVCGV